MVRFCRFDIVTEENPLLSRSKDILINSSDPCMLIKARNIYYLNLNQSLEVSLVPGKLFLWSDFW